MKKILKLMMLMFIATFSVTLTSCGDDDEPNSKDDISTAGKLNTVTVTLPGGKNYTSDMVTIDVGCRVYYRVYDSVDSNEHIYCNGGRIVYAGDFSDLSSVTTAPIGTDPYSEWAYFYNDGCYIVKSNTGNYIRLKVSMNNDETEMTFKFQTYNPTNI